MDRNNNSTVIDVPRGLPSLKRTCLIQPKLTGVASLVIQFGILIVSGITAMFFFYHVGGYEYMMWNENSTILEPVHHHKMFIESTSTALPTTTPTTTEKPTTTTEQSIIFTDEFANDEIAKTLLTNGEFEMYANVSNQVLERKLRDSDDEGNTTDIASNEIVEYIESLLTNEVVSNDTFGIEQVPMTTIDVAGLEFDLLEMIRISTLVYLCCCIFWFLSLFCLLLSIKCELVDLVIINTTILFIVVIYLLCHSGLIGSLLYFQPEMSWRTMSITIGTLVILTCCSILGLISLALNYGWIGYITFMHNDIRCHCISVLVGFIKGSHNTTPPPPMEYSMPENVRPAEVRYNEDGPVQQFSAF